jgi:opacity protein-like surface antigen
MRKLLLLTTLAVGASAVQASNGLFYFGAGATSNHVSLSEQQGYAGFLPSDMNGTSWQAFAGIRPISLLAVEADYIDLGSQANSRLLAMSCVDSNGQYCAVARKSNAKALAGYAVGFLPIPLPFLDVYGKAGVARYKLDDNLSYNNGAGVPTSSTANGGNSTVFTWGAGLQAHIGMIGGRLEYTGFSKASTSVFSLSIFLNLG